jgi:hypothetical protein
MADPQKNPTPTPPDPQQGHMIPVASITLPAGVKLAFPGKRGAWNAINATKPSAGEFTSIMFDPRLRHHIVAFFKPGADPKRAPTDTLYVPEAMVTWRRA